MPRLHVRLKIGDIRLEYEGQQTFFDRYIDPLVRAVHARGVATGGEAPSAEAESSDDGGVVFAEPAPRPEPEGYRPQSSYFSKFLRDVGPRAAQPMQQVMAFGFYLWNYEGKEQFSVPEIEGCFEAISQPVPEDTTALFEDLVSRRRFLEPAGEEGAWRLTHKGKNYAKNRLLTSV